MVICPVLSSLLVNHLLNIDGGCLCTSPGFCLYSSVFPCTLSRELELSWSPQTVSNVSSVQDDCQALPQSPLHVLWPENSLKTVSLENSKVRFICFSALRGYYPSLPDGLCLENCPICSVHFLASSVRVNRFTVY